MRIRTNATYTFRRAGWDRFDPKVTIADGTRVRVVKLPGAPPPNTMGHAHIDDAVTGELGLVSTASLVKS